MILVVTNGCNKIDLEDLNSILKYKELKFEKLKGIEPICPFFHFNSYSKVFLNESIFSLKEEEIYMESGTKLQYFAMDLNVFKVLMPKEIKILSLKTIEETKKI